MAVFFISSAGLCRLSGGRPRPPVAPRYFFRSFKISRAAFAPDPPVRPAPGCVPEPHKYKFRFVECAFEIIDLRPNVDATFQRLAIAVERGKFGQTGQRKIYLRHRPWHAIVLKL